MSVGEFLILGLCFIACFFLFCNWLPNLGKYFKNNLTFERKKWLRASKKYGLLVLLSLFTPSIVHGATYYTNQTISATPSATTTYYFSATNQQNFTTYAGANNVVSGWIYNATLRTRANAITYCAGLGMTVPSLGELFTVANTETSTSGTNFPYGSFTWTISPDHAIDNQPATYGIVGRYESSGHGLSISRTLLAGSNGTLCVTSTDLTSATSTFTFSDSITLNPNLSTIGAGMDASTTENISTMVNTGDILVIIGVIIVIFYLLDFIRRVALANRK